MAWTYDSTATEPRDQLRLLIGDVLQADQQFQDEELDYILTGHPSLLSAAAAACRALASRYARYADKWVGNLKILASQKSRQYLRQAEEFDQQLVKSHQLHGVPSAGGVYVMEKVAYRQNDALVQNTIQRGMHDNIEG
jgi:hypothetical protein